MKTKKGKWNFIFLDYVKVRTILRHNSNGTCSASPILINVIAFI